MADRKKVVDRLLKDGHINFDEALELMEKEVVKQIITLPYIDAPQFQPLPYTPIYPTPYQPWYGPNKTTFFLI